MIYTPLADLILSSDSEPDDGEADAGDVDAEGDTLRMPTGQVWQLRRGRVLDPQQSSGLQLPARLKIHNFRDKTELDFFQAVFPSELVPDIAQAVTEKGRTVCKFGPAWSMSAGEVWLFLGYQMHMLVNPVPGDKKKLWAKDPVPGSVYIPQDHGKYGMTHSRWRQAQRAFCLPTHPDGPGEPDPFKPIRFFEEHWNKAQYEALAPGKNIVVDESMGLWKGRGMPGLMKVMVKPTMPGICIETMFCTVGFL